MADNKQLKQVHDASWDVVNSLRETNQTVADSLVALQDHNLKFTHNIFLSWADVLTQQTESTRRLQQQWGQQIRVQQEAFQRLTSTLSQVYVDFLLTPLAFSRTLVEATESAIEHEEKESRKASR
jgi:hypothetical protein